MDLYQVISNLVLPALILICAFIMEEIATKHDLYDSETKKVNRHGRRVRYAFLFVLIFSVVKGIWDINHQISDNREEAARISADSTWKAKATLQLMDCDTSKQEAKKFGIQWNGFTKEWEQTKIDSKPIDPEDYIPFIEAIPLSFQTSQEQLYGVTKVDLAIANALEENHPATNVSLGLMFMLDKNGHIYNDKWWRMKTDIISKTIYAHYDIYDIEGLNINIKQDTIYLLVTAKFQNSKGNKQNQYTTVLFYLPNMGVWAHVPADEQARFIQKANTIR